MFATCGVSHKPAATGWPSKVFTGWLFCSGARCHGSPSHCHGPTNLNKLSSSSSSPLRRERCQTDRTTKLLGRVKVPRGARRVGIKKGRERCKKESGLDHPPLHHLALTQSLFFGEHQPASPPSAKPPPNIAPMSLNPQVARPMICWTYNSLDLRVAGP